MNLMNTHHIIDKLVIADINQEISFVRNFVKKIRGSLKSQKARFTNDSPNFFGIILFKVKFSYK